MSFCDTTANVRTHYLHSWLLLLLLKLYITLSLISRDITMPNQRPEVYAADVVSTQKTCAKKFIDTTSQLSTALLNSRIYPYHTTSPRTIKLPTSLMTTGRKVPIVEQAIRGYIQPYVHDCDVELRVGRKSHLYRVFFKNHKNLPINCSIFRASSTAFRGDVLVMSLNPNDNSVQAMQPGDSKRMDLVVKG